MMHDWWNWTGGGWGGMWLGPLVMLLVVIAAIAVIVAIVRWMSGMGGQSATSPGSHSARDILDQRFARGEIDADEYEARKRALQQ